jgi:hypothetical protein
MTMKIRRQFFPILLLAVLTLSCSQKKAGTPDEQANTEDTPKDTYEAIQGAWTTKDRNANGEQVTATTIVMDGYIAEAFYNVERKEFTRTFGGSWTIEGNTFTLNYEFSSSDSTQVGTSRDIVFHLKGDTIRFDGDDRVWSRIDDGRKGNLSGAWLITGRERDGEMTRREPGVRKTMKILSDTRFQWIAYNTETGQFFGTGGGTYTAKDKEYQENIEFFSRDSSRVGASLSFEFGIVNDEWHHKGLSSKGEPIHEVWTLREDLEKK